MGWKPATKACRSNLSISHGKGQDNICWEPDLYPTNVYGGRSQDFPETEIE